MTKVQRYKVGYYTDEWGMSSITPCLIPDDIGFAVKFEDYCKLEAENERLKHNLATTEQTMREYQELAAKRLEEIDRLKDERESHGPEGRNYTNLQVVEMRQKFTERINEQKAELAKYRDAPIVAWCHYDYAEKTADYLQHFKDTYASIPLIVKPGEEK